MSHAYARLHYHLVFSTKRRQRFIVPELKDRLYAYLVGIVSNLDGIVEEIGGVEDHVHLLLFLPPKLAPADAIRTLKANSSKWVHDSWPARAAFGWQRGYGLFSVSESNVPAVKHYLQTQVEHHRQISFQDEFRRLLKKHGIEYDENELWD